MMDINVKIITLKKKLIDKLYMEFTDPLEQITDISTDKYKQAGKITCYVLDQIIQKIAPEVDIYELCKYSDKLIVDETNKIYGKIKHKGICFPTCISRNNIVGHYSPVEKDGIIKEGDLIKIELGVHIDGYPCQIAYTYLVNNGDKLDRDDKRARVLKAVGDASKDILTVMKPGKTNKDVVNILNKYSTAYNCNLPLISELNDNNIVPGIMSYQTSRDIIDGFNEDEYQFVHRMILSRESENYGFTMRETEFEENEIYTIDVVMSSGDGHLSESQYEPTIFKRRTEKFAGLRLNASKDAIVQFGKSRFPINLRDHNNARFKLGLKECLQKGIVDRYPVYREKDGEYTARVKFTVLIKKQPVLLTGRSIDDQIAKVNI